MDGTTAADGLGSTTPREGAGGRNGLLGDERGTALVLALMVSLVLAIALSAVLELTASGARSTNLSNAGQKAYALAEVGLNNALAQLAVHYPNSASAGSPSWVGSPSPVS